MPYQSPLYAVEKAAKTDKKDIMRFYKAQRYAASYIGQDQCYFIKGNNEIIACAMVSAGQENGELWLLHALVTEKAYRGKGLASLLLRFIMAESKVELQQVAPGNTVDKNEPSLPRYSKIICFADKVLQPLYLSNKFINYNAVEDIAQLPNEFQQRLSRYREKQSNLCCYLYNA